MSFCLILLAAGNSRRFGSKIPKPFVKVGKKSLIEYSLSKFNKIKKIKKKFVVINNKHAKFLKNTKSTNFSKIIGGKTRQESTYKALRYIKKNRIKCTHVLIHDAARPNFSINLLKRLKDKLKKNKAVIPYVKTENSSKYKKGNKILNLDREKLLFTQTPQCFDFKTLYNLSKHNKKIVTDEASLFLNKNKKIKFIKGEENNFKITKKSDLNKLNIKSFFGIGFDIHRLIKNKKLYLGGIKYLFIQD